MRTLAEVDALRCAAHREGLRLSGARREALAWSREFPEPENTRRFMRTHEATVRQRIRTRVLTLTWAWLRGVPRSRVEGCVPRQFYYWWLAQEVARQLMPQATYTERAETTTNVRDWLVQVADGR